LHGAGADRKGAWKGATPAARSEGPIARAVRMGPPGMRPKEKSSAFTLAFFMFIQKKLSL